MEDLRNLLTWLESRTVSKLLGQPENSQLALLGSEKINVYQDFDRISNARETNCWHVRNITESATLEVDLREASPKLTQLVRS